MQNFNLIDQPWIPVRWTTGSETTHPRLVSLGDAFRRGHEIAELDCAPHERIALTRLLVCITHAALGAPEDSEDWDGFGDDVHTKVPDYLNRPDIYPHFNLLGDGPRFLQEEVVATKDPVPCSKLIPYLATGNNPTLLDHSGMNANRSYSKASIALALLTFQNFYPLYGAGYKGRGPCSDSNTIHTLICGSSLGQTICLNMLDMESIESLSPNGIGKPIWECQSKDELEESTQTYLGRLVPRHRSLKLSDDLKGFYHQKDSLQYPGWEPFREPSSTIILNKKEERRILPARPERAIWRDLHSITSLHLTSGKSHLRAEAPSILESHSSLLEEETLPLWTGALITDLKAKILDTVESTFTIPYGMLTEDGRHVYASGIEHAETVSQKLYGAIKSYWGALKHETPPVGEGQKHYWHRLDQEHKELIRLAGDPEARRGQASFGEANAKDLWTELVRDAAKAAYNSVCPRTTPRQIQAYAAGIKLLMRALFPKKKTSKDYAPQTV
ncbi:MAG: type I-E CRISPR-associated protein Cse1/CasA [Verrucomicrobiota bacterium]